MAVIGAQGAERRVLQSPAGRTANIGAATSEALPESYADVVLKISLNEHRIQLPGSDDDRFRVKVSHPCDGV
jgi:hypothetical protein